MIILTGNNLGERQRDLNVKVNEAASKHINFEEIKETTEKSDVDKLFKIDLASKYKNVEYIIEVLKSGDSLYISRALKCVWIYNDDFDNIINVDHLHNNVMPFMSTKMKKKFLTAISMHVRNEERAAAFYKYCMDIKFTNIALKFLNFTSNTFKLELLEDSSTCSHPISEVEGEYIKHFIGLSFTLADAYVAIFFENNRLPVFRELSYLYTVSDVKYLDLLEKYVVVTEYNNVRLGLRISRSIMKNNKDRVLRNPLLYVRILSKSVLVRYSTANDAKIYAVDVLPDTAEKYWKLNYCNNYKFILDLIPNGKFEFIKRIFTEKYPSREFEMTLNFYEKQYYKFMTAEERETWALKHIASEAEILGIGKDYIWYRFVSFDKALEEIKKLVMITPDNTKRADMMNMLIESAKNQRDVEKLLKHYYERHVNEQRHIKENFLDRIIQFFNVYEFDEDCWAALDKMFYNLEVYSTTDLYNCKTEYKLISLIYCIINNKEVHEAINMYIKSNMYFYSLKLNTDKLSKEQEKLVFNYLFEFYMDEIREFENVSYADEVKYELRKYINFVLDLLHQYDKTKYDCPELVNKFMMLDWDEFMCHRLLREPAKYKEPTRDVLLRDLKKDAKILLKKLPIVKKNIDSSNVFHISTILQKLKIYFSYDIAKDYLKFFHELLTEKNIWHKVAQAAVHGIFQLGDENYKADFLTKYAPTEAKINRSEIDEKFLLIQQAICCHAYYSRPPVLLKYMLMYIKGDYVHFCLPMFHSYLANLPLPLCMEFIESILNTPMSIQKHGIRLAFECFNAENLNKLVLRVWKQTKNVSLRMIIFKAVFNKISEVQVGQDILFETLKTITSTLNQDDDDEIFGLLVSNKLPSHMTPEYIELAWKVVSQLPLKTANVNRMCSIIDFMRQNINTIRQDAVRDIVVPFIAAVFKQEEGGKIKINIESNPLTDAKWNLTAAYIMNVKNKGDVNIKLELTKKILKHYLEPLVTGNHEKKYALRRLCFKFIHNLENQIAGHEEFLCYENTNIIMQVVLQTLEETLAVEEIYMMVWEIRLGIIARKVLVAAKMKLKERGEHPDVMRSVAKDIAGDLAKELGGIITQFVKKDIYFASFSKDIRNRISDTINEVNTPFNVELQDIDMLIAVIFELLQFESTEIYLLVLDLLSARYPNPKHKEDFKFIINKMKKLDNKEIWCNLYRNFDEFMYS